jgi:MoaA/NifB/PqqE/SkfB family radical SAM enzyme
MTLDELKGVFLQAKALGAKEIVIPGEGEPFFDNNLFSLINFASANGLKVTVFTNGTLIDRNIADTLFRHKVFVVFKLHSLNRSVYESLAGRSNVVTWENCCVGEGGNNTFTIPVGLKCLLQAGYGHKSLFRPLNSNLCIETVVVRQNIQHIPIIAQFCEQLGIKCMVETLIRTNRADRDASTLGVTAEEEMKLFEDLRRILGWRFVLRQKKRCRFETNPFLDISGNIRHCFGLGAKIGNIREMPLAELHENELGIRKETGMLNRRYSFSHQGFLTCASRRFIGRGV